MPSAPGTQPERSIRTEHGGIPEILQHHQDREGTLVVAATGRWIIEQSETLDRLLGAIDAGAAKTVRFDLSKISELDTLGTWLLVSTRERLGAKGIDVHFHGLHPQHQALLNHLARTRHHQRSEGEQDEQVDAAARAAPVPDPLAAPVAALGTRIAAAAAEARDFVAFIGLTLARTLSMRRHHHPLKFGSVVFQLEQSWLRALSTAALSTFFVGLAAMYLGAAQLTRLGAGDIAVQAISFAILLEIGVLLPAILVAGRSASAFAAQIGAMKTGDEVNAMLVAGLDPMVTLIIPRVVALIIALALLGIVGQIAGLVGCFLMAWAHLGLSLGDYMQRVETAAGIEIFLIGIMKTPFLGAIIAFVGCFHGMKVSGAATEVGQRTTRAVVQALVFVILFDAFYTVGLWLAVVRS